MSRHWHYPVGIDSIWRHAAFLKHTSCSTVRGREKSAVRWPGQQVETKYGAAASPPKRAVACLRVLLQMLAFPPPPRPGPCRPCRPAQSGGSSPERERAPQKAMAIMTQSDSTHWYALRVKSNRERVTALGLKGKGYPVFLPECKRAADGPRQGETPLFPGYLFCRFDVNNRLPILTLPGMVRIVGFGKHPAPVDPDELESLKIVVLAGLPVQREECFAVGQPIRIPPRPACGRRRNRHRHAATAAGCRDLPAAALGFGGTGPGLDRQAAGISAVASSE